MILRDRDRLVVLKKAQQHLITRRQAAVELQLTECHVRRLLIRLKKVGDKAVLHDLRGRASNRELSEKREAGSYRFCRARCRDFGLTVASEYLAKKHKMRIGREA